MRDPQAAPHPPQVILDQLSQVGRWEPFEGPTGKYLWHVPGSGGATYTLSEVSCTCPADEYARSRPCKHRVTLALYRSFVMGYLGHVRAFRALTARAYPTQPPQEADTDAPGDPDAAPDLQPARRPGG